MLDGLARVGDGDALGGVDACDLVRQEELGDLDGEVPGDGAESYFYSGFSLVFASFFLFFLGHGE